MKHSLTRTQKWTRIVYMLVLSSFILPIGYLIYRLIAWDEETAQALSRTQADYALMLVQCLLGIVVIHLPTFLTKHFHFELPAALYIMYILFLYGAIFLGEVRSFYYTVPNWDVFLHAFSSLMAGSFGFMAVALLNRNEHVPIRLSPFFVALFAFCFAVTIGALWEIYEFSFDGFLGLNMQKFMTADGEMLAGRAALTDTMKDIIVDCLGALTASVAGYISLKNGRGWASDMIAQHSQKHEQKAAK